MELFCIDTGTTQSAYCLFNTENNNIQEIGILANNLLAKKLRTMESLDTRLVLEMFKSYGMAVGDSVLLSCLWIGRFIECAKGLQAYELIPRKTIVSKLCGRATGKDSNVRQAIIDHFCSTNHYRGGEYYQAGQSAKSITKKGGSLHKISKDMWASLAIALTFEDIIGDLLL